ncbi:MAG TPA: helix-turn-helix domain-containing protein [Thermoanaerobaculia bacterium]|nr:helix-turn-helix domain-containing protein [Thermoanaerobaculia bacterium]
MQLPQAIIAARKDLRLSQKKLSELAGIQRRQLATLEAGGNVTLSTLRKVLAHLPNLQTFSFEAVRVNVEMEIPVDEKRFQDALLGLSASLSTFAEQLARRGYPVAEDLEAIEDIQEQLTNMPPEPDPAETERAMIQSTLRQIAEEEGEDPNIAEAWLESEVERRVAERLKKMGQG